MPERGAARRPGLLLVLLLTGLTPATAEMFKWVDDAGNVHYGDTPPPEARIGTISDATITVVPTRQIPDTAPDVAAIIYTTQRCPHCVRAKEHLARRGIVFEERDVERSAEYRREFRALGGRGVPLIRVGEQILKGYGAAKLERILEQAGL